MKPATELQIITWRHNGNLRSLKGMDTQLAVMAYNTYGLNVTTRNDIHTLRKNIRELAEVVRREQNEFRENMKAKR